ncbi:MAG: type II toxin-antitoxin system VapC family toxin [Micrococcales bacterium]
MYLIDDGIIANAIAGDSKLLDRLERLGTDQWAIPANVAAEVIFDIANNPGVFKEMRESIENFLRNSRIMPLDFETLRLAAESRVAVADQETYFERHKITTYALALSMNAILVTRDKHFYPSSDELVIDRW